MSWQDTKNEDIHDDQLETQIKSEGSLQSDELETCTKEINELKDAARRVAADFENFKKRVERDRALWSQAAQAEVFIKLLPIVDDFDRALQQAYKQERTSELAAWLAGFELINKSLYKFLQSFDVRPIEHMSQFDPEFHEAIAQVESPDHASGAIVEVAQKGFMMKDRVLRPARVTVAK